MVAYCRQLDGRALEALLRVKAPKLLEDFDKWQIAFLGYLKQWTDVLGIAHERERGLFLFVG